MLDILLSMMQINIALGILYIGLGVSRYRNRLHEAIVASIHARVGTRDDSTASIYAQMLDDDDEFREKHDKVSLWIGELPDRYSNQLVGTSAGLFSTKTEGVQVPPKPYRWYKFNLDRWITFIIASVIPIGLTWYLAVCPSNPPPGIIYPVLAIGQVLVAGHVLAGWWMVRHYRDDFSEALKYVVVALEGISATKRAQGFTAQFTSHGRRSGPG